MFNIFSNLFANRRSAESAAPEPGGSTSAHAANPAELLGNPLRTLTPTRAAQLVYDGMQGRWTTAQWVMYYVETLDADVYTITDRRLSGLRELNWTIRTDAKADESGLQKLADAQRETLHERYMAIDNMREAVEHLATAKFRGYAHLAVSETHLEPLDQWWWIRDGMYGDWYYNPDARSASPQSLGAAVDPADYIIRTEPRCLIWLSILKFLSSNYSKKWWDRFLEISARLGNVVIAPDNVRDADSFAAHARSIAAGNSGWLPNGSSIEKTGPDVMRGTKSPWEMRLRYLKEDLILAGTGGMLTALSQSTGIGSGNADEHGDVWRTLLRADARDISEVLQEQMDKRILAAEFPGKPMLAWFELDTTETPSIDTILGHAKTAKEAGYMIDADELAELTGYTLTAIAGTPAAGGLPNRRSRRADTLHNRSATAEEAGRMLEGIAAQLDVPAAWLAPVADRLRALESALGGSTDVRTEEAAALLEELAEAAPELFGDMDIDALGRVLEGAMGAAALDGAEQVMAGRDA